MNWKFLLFFLISFGHSQSDYSELVNITKNAQKDFYTLYKANQISKDTIVSDARRFIFSMLTKEFFPHWYGTPWNFYGSTRTPKKGNIACGYFITTVLTDVGFDIPLTKWAQSASEIFIKKLTPNCFKFSNKPISEIRKHLLNQGNGLYLVGLDCHTGFIVVRDSTIKFVHASYYKPEIGVMSEDIDTWNPFRDSHYRVIGKLLTNEMIVNWITSYQYK